MGSQNARPGRRASEARPQPGLVARGVCRRGASSARIVEAGIPVVGHVGLPYDGTVYSGIQDALAHRAITLSCFAL